jgi:hypothetical protein
LDNGFVPDIKGDISGTVSEMIGSYIRKTPEIFWDHITGMNNNVRGLYKAIDRLQGSGEVQAIVARQQALPAIGQADTAVRGAGI